MPITFRTGFSAGLVVALFLGIWLTRLWSAENQVRLHTEHLLRQLEKRNWSGAGDFVAASYRDDWGDDRLRLLTRLNSVLDYVFSLTITASDAQIQVQQETATWRGRIHFEGRGEFADEIAARVNGLTSPFELRWQRQSGWPWDWQLVGASNPALQVPPDDQQ